MGYDMTGEALKREISGFDLSQRASMSTHGSVFGQTVNALTAAPMGIAGPSTPSR